MWNDEPLADGDTTTTALQVKEEVHSPKIGASNGPVALPAVGWELHFPEHVSCKLKRLSGVSRNPDDTGTLINMLGQEDKIELLDKDIWCQIVLKKNYRVVRCADWPGNTANIIKKSSLPCDYL